MKAYDLDVELTKFQHANERSEGLLFVICESPQATPQQIGLVSAYITSHLFFLCRGGHDSVILLNRFLQKKIDDNILDRKIVFLNPMFVLYSERLIDNAINIMNLAKEDLVSCADEESGLWICKIVTRNFLINKGMNIDAFENSRILANQIILVNKHEHHYESLHGEMEFMSKDKHLQLANNLKSHLASLFVEPFIFNTELYSDVDKLENLDADVLIGLASGFKLHYLAAKKCNQLKKIIFFDQNKNALDLKKIMIEHWNGKNFPEWLFSHDILNQFRTAEQSIDVVSALWEKEKDLWGGETEIQNFWKFQQKVPIIFLNEDIQGIPRVISDLGSETKLILWISNVWNNEFIFQKYGAENIFSEYKEWIVRLVQANKNTLVLQSKIFFPQKTVYFSGFRAEEIRRSLLTELF